MAYRVTKNEDGKFELINLDDNSIVGIFDTMKEAVETRRSIR